MRRAARRGGQARAGGEPLERFLNPSHDRAYPGGGGMEQVSISDGEEVTSAAAVATFTSRAIQFFGLRRPARGAWRAVKSVVRTQADYATPGVAVVLAENRADIA